MSWYHEKSNGAWFCFLLSLILGLYFLHFPLGSALRRASYDLPFLFSSSTYNTNIAVIYIDDSSLNKLGRQPDGSLDRRWHALLLDRLTREKTRLVVYDIAFTKADATSQADVELARAIRANSRVILPATYESVLVDEAFIRQIFPPHELFATNAARWGVAFLQPDRDHVVRLLPTSVQEKESLVWASMLVADSWPARADRTQSRLRQLNHYRPRDPRSAPFAEVDFATAVDTNTLPDGFFRNKAVFIGARRSVGPIGQERDRFETPFSAWLDDYPEMPGVVLHATVFANLERGDWIYSLAPLAESIIVVLIAGSLCLILLPLRPFFATIAWLLTMTAISVAGVLLQRLQGIAFPWLIPLAILSPVAFIWACARNWLKPGRPIAFISYRRKEGEGSGYALGVWAGLRLHGINCSFDVVDLRSGDWRRQIIVHMCKVRNVIVIVSNNSLSTDRISDPRDPFLWEIRLARKLKKNLVPVLIPPYKLPADLPRPARWLHSQHWWTYHHDTPRTLIWHLLNELEFSLLSRLWLTQQLQSLKAKVFSKRSRSLALERGTG